MEAARESFDERLDRIRDIVLLVAQIAIPIVGIVYLFVRGADVHIVTLILVTLYSLRPAPADRPSVPAALVDRLAGGQQPAQSRDRKAS